MIIDKIKLVFNLAANTHFGSMTGSTLVDIATRISNHFVEVEHRELGGSYASFIIETELLNVCEWASIHDIRELVNIIHQSSDY